MTESGANSLAKRERSSKTARKPEAAAPVPASPNDVLKLFHPVTETWFRAVFEEVTAPQREGWPAIARGESTLILAPTGTGKTLTAFLWCLDRLMLRDPATKAGCRVLYVSPLKALAVDVERNLRSPLAGIANMAEREGDCRRMFQRSVFARGIRVHASVRGSGGIPERFLSRRLSRCT